VGGTNGPFSIIWEANRGGGNVEKGSQIHILTDRGDRHPIIKNKEKKLSKKAILPTGRWAVGCWEKRGGGPRTMEYDKGTVKQIREWWKEEGSKADSQRKSN